MTWTTNETAALSDHAVITIFEHTFNQTAIGMAHISLDGKIFRVNPRFCELTGYSQDHILDKTLDHLLYMEETGIESTDALKLVRGELESVTTIYRYLKQDGEMLWGLTTITLIKNSSVNPHCFIFSLVDITEKIKENHELKKLYHKLQSSLQEQSQLLNITLQRKLKFKHALSEEREKLQSIANDLPTLIASLDADLCFTFHNKAFCTWFDISGDQSGQPIKSVIGDKIFNDLMPYFTAVLSGEKVNCELPLNNSDGEIYVEVILVPCNELNQTRFHCFMFNITEHKQLQNQYEFEARHDPLTSLPNRREFMQLLDKALDSSSSLLNMAVSFIDIDNFKEVNDTFGHEIGDLTLIEVANILKVTPSNGGTAARLAGDEFVVIMTNLQSPQEQLAKFCSSIIYAVNQIHHAHQDSFLGYVLSVSIGVTFIESFKGIPLTASQILEKADFAMYKAKSLGKNQYYIS